MAIEIDGKVFRNLEEQVAYLSGRHDEELAAKQDKIESISETMDTVEPGEYGAIKFSGTATINGETIDSAEIEIPINAPVNQYTTVEADNDSLFVSTKEPYQYAVVHDSSIGFRPTDKVASRYGFNTTGTFGYITIDMSSYSILQQPQVGDKFHYFFTTGSGKTLTLSGVFIADTNHIALEDNCIAEVSGVYISSAYGWAVIVHNTPIS